MKKVIVILMGLSLVCAAVFAKGGKDKAGDQTAQAQVESTEGDTEIGVVTEENVYPMEDAK